ncbi:MAG: histidine phosphatase family protein [Burkholderiaceae bacterium]|nr:histidine phosphatase family protein [Burkholderiaceae bacterium]
MQQITRIFAIRHGETDWNVDTRVQGQRDIALNDTGRWQARQLSLAVAQEGIDAVYASDLQRALDTALSVAAGAGLTVVTDIGLRERHFGEFEGYTSNEIEQRWPGKAQRWRQRDPDFSPQGGESLRQLLERSVNTATRLASAHFGQTIALVAHGGVIDSLYRAAMHIDLQMPRTWQLGNASINRLIYTPQGFNLLSWSDTQHLEGGPQLDDSNQRRVRV